MKPAFAKITLFFFLFAFSTKSSPVAASTPEPVVDISGEKLKAGVSYYVLPFVRGRGGGLSYDTFGKDTCPHVLVQEKLEVSSGKPVQFLPLNPKNHVIYTSRNLNIKFSNLISTCVESGVWKITKFISEALNVATDGAAANQDFFNWFMIEKTENNGVYILKFCPKPSSVVCQDLAVFSNGDDGKRYVGLTNPGEFQQLLVMFKKADVKDAIIDGEEDVMSS
ncbi:kunitz trypsin inhibitor 2-like [Neltuma alba]|uniref:kunitz trypsin inhibitor 2-like n=1 Tax=Neltuma alba TaxID=207710 RepID=UPI0010A3694D|nr:kunitz trypsin inhibitor 2-like [Prosopis alba]